MWDSMLSKCRLGLYDRTVSSSPSSSICISSSIEAQVSLMEIPLCSFMNSSMVLPSSGQKVYVAPMLIVPTDSPDTSLILATPDLTSSAMFLAYGRNWIP